MRTLADHVEQSGPLAVRDAIGWTLRASLTLWALHEEGILHGRISPAAILVEDSSCRSDGILVRPSELDDEPFYQSLDRAEGGGASKGDDVWAIGVTLYYLLTGELPYPKGVVESKQRGRVKPPPPLAVHGASLDVMQPVLDRLIRADRADRLQAAEEIVAGLRDLSPLIADVAPLAIERAFDETDRIPEPGQPPSEPPVRQRDEEAWRKLTASSLAPPTAKAESDPTRMMIYAFAGALVVGGIVFLMVSPDAPDDAPPDAPATSVVSTSPGPVVPAVSSSVREPAPSARDTGSARAPLPEPPSPASPPTQDFVACTSSMFAGDAFAHERPVADFPCGEPEPSKAVERMTALLVRGSAGQATDATREWSNLGWYRIAAFAVARGRCCDAPAPLRSPRLVKVCELDDALEALSKAANSAHDDVMAKAIERFGAAASCVGSAGGGPIFGQPGLPNSQQAVLFLRMIGRMRSKR